MTYDEAMSRIAQFTPEKLASMSFVMMAAALGMQIQNRPHDNPDAPWITAPPIWDWAHHDYRVKP